MAIFQGDQYSIPFEIAESNAIVTPENVDDVRIVIGNMERRYSDNTLSFAEGKWLFPLYSSETACLCGHIRGQVEITHGDNISHSETFCISVKESLPIFKKGATT